MGDALFDSLSLVDFSGYLIIAAIVVLMMIGVAVTIYVRARYAKLEQELRRSGEPHLRQFESPVLIRIAREVEVSTRRHGGDSNTQAIVENCIQAELNVLLVGERFVKATTGLLIILGLVGTFYGLTLSIGKLVALVAGDVSSATEITSSLTRGLTEALVGMSVAFSTSLFGIIAAILMTLLGVFANVADRRISVMVQIESYMDNVLLPAMQLAVEDSPRSLPRGAAGISLPAGDLERMVVGFGHSVAQLQSTVAQFESALQAFSTSTRDFQEFNHHLKDNIQRMSLSFGDLTDTLKQQVTAMREDNRR